MALEMQRFREDPEVWARGREKARREGTTLSAVLRRLLRAWLEEEPEV